MNRKARKQAKMAVVKPLAPAQVHPIKSGMKISADAEIVMRQKPAKKSREESLRELFKPYTPAKGVLPEGHRPTLAMDSAYSNAFNLGALANINSVFSEGYAFPGFPILAEWAQIPEYRKPAEIIAREMTRKWIKFKAVGEEDKSEKIKKIEAEFKRLNVQAKFRELIEQDGLFGRSQLFIDTGMETSQLDREELKTELAEVPEKVGLGSIKRLTVIEPIWSYPNRYNANDPLDPTFYKPTSWFVMGKEIHSSRLLTVITREVPDILKPAYAFSGLSLSQMMKPYIDNWLRTRQSVSDLIHSFTVWVLKTDMSVIMNAGGAESFFSRLQIFNSARDNHGVNAINAETEEFSNVSANLGSLDKLQAQSQEQMCAPGGIPLVYLTGITPAGLNASSIGEIEVFQDNINANQEILTPHLSKILNLVQLSLFGEIDPGIGFIWEPLRTMTPREKAEIRKYEAETDAIHVEMGSITNNEVRTRVANEEDSPYSGLDLNIELDVPLENPGHDPGMKHFREMMNGEEDEESTGQQTQ